MAFILVVDDDRVVRESVEFVLRRAGHGTVCARDGDEAFASLAAHAFDVVITDLYMPMVGGAEVIARARQLPYSPRIIAMSAGMNGQTAADHLRDTGQKADIVLNKPFSLSAIIDGVTRLTAARGTPGQEDDSTRGRAELTARH